MLVDNCGWTLSQKQRVFLNTWTLFHLNKSCVFNVDAIGVSEVQFSRLNDLKRVHVSHGLSPGLRRIRVGVYG